MSTSSSNDKELKDLADALARTNKQDKLYDFLHGILTPRERETIALRWQLVKMLEKGVQQRNIADRLGISLCKITRGSRELKHGRKGFRDVVRTALR